ncbi:hypothetical protein L1887_23841 [Cichorium endivia]|nr:hypothetical protein L1887_23841 [Cichorium endivia]
MHSALTTFLFIDASLHRPSELKAGALVENHSLSGLIKEEFPTVRYRVKPTNGYVESTFRELAIERLSDKMDNLMSKNKAAQLQQNYREEGLRFLGQIEQDLVFSDARNKELLEFLEEYEDPNIESRLTLMMIYALADPEKFEGDNGKDI